jgi:hypothetical protein
METLPADELKQINAEIRILLARKRQIREQMLNGDVPLFGERCIAKIEQRIVLRDRTDSDILLRLRKPSFV